ncbi:hypothetical protein IE077_003427 [Cardiosporidium cionae]|uniref:Uncharacterized protein n=1 Tax=Cardiosporidium cionae TaxID=476202 RepID=A0ABQ7JF03_9APIC|nr:hypothetical protein IE077_003427 [Cardiosporidium cionae]|eukprot:KAF8822579.1 hypothetical protein IE077_003427 [Cardiosporidium cionae]
MWIALNHEALWKRRDRSSIYLKSNISVKMLHLSSSYVEIWLFLCLFVLPFFLFCCAQRNDSRSSNGTSNDGERVSKTKKARRKPVISLTLNEILLKFGPKKEITLVDESSTAFLRLCSLTELYVFTEVTSCEEEAIVLSILKGLNAFESGLKPHRLMFSSTSEGRVSMVRQLQPLLHIDCNYSVTKALSGKVQQVVLVKLERETSVLQLHQNGFNSLQECADVIADISMIENL